MSIVFLRQHLKKIVGAVIVLIIPFFVLWGVGDYFRSKRSRPYGAKIFGKKIDYSDFTYARHSTRLNSIINLIRLGLSPEQAQKITDTDPDALNDMSWERLMLIEKARQDNINATNDEASSFILSNPIFYDPQTNSFNHKYYELILTRGLGIPVDFYEGMVRDTILVSKVSSWVLDNTKATSQELIMHNKIENDKIEVDYVYYSSDDFEHGLTNTRDEARGFYENHQDLFLLPSQVDIEYFTVGPETYKADIEVSAEEIEGYYETNKDIYESAQTISARHILISHNDAERSTSQVRTKEEALIKAEGLLTKLKNDPRLFPELAAQESDGPSAAKEGDLGSFERGVMDTAFEEAAFALEIDEISDIVETPFGFHIIRTYDKQEAAARELAEVTDDIRITLFDEKIKSYVRMKASALVDELLDIYDERLGDALTPSEETLRSLSDLAKKHAIEHHRSGWFSGEERLDAQWYFSELIDEAEELGPGEPCDIVFQNNEEYYIFQVIAKREPFIPPFEESLIKADLLLTGEKADNAALAKARRDRNLIATLLLASEKEFRSVAKNMNLTVFSPDAFSYTGSVKELKDDLEFTRACFKLEERELSHPIDLSSGWALAMVKKLTPADDILSDHDALAKMRQSRRSAKSRLIYDAWIDELKKTGLMINTTP